MDGHRPTAAFITPAALPRSFGQLATLAATATVSMQALEFAKMNPAMIIAV